MRKTGVCLTGAVLLATMVVPVSAANAQAYLQCVPFARMMSGIDLFGRAASWWHQAVGRYEQGSLPQAGSVLVFKAISSMRSGHVATVSRVLSERVIEVTHANWSIIRGRRGQIERNVQVVDVSPANDWSQVKVWWAPQQGLGTRAYPTYGFIYSNKLSRPPEPGLATPMLASAVTTKPVATPLLTPHPSIMQLMAARPVTQATPVGRPIMATLRPPAPQPMWTVNPLPVIVPPAPPAPAPATEQIALR
jgi:surface antigen